MFLFLLVKPLPIEANNRPITKPMTANVKHPHWSSMDNIRLYCHFKVTLYKITKITDNNF